MTDIIPRTIVNGRLSPALNKKITLNRGITTGVRPCLQNVYKMSTKCLQSVYNSITTCLQLAYETLTGRLRPGGGLSYLKAGSLPDGIVIWYKGGIGNEHD